MGGFTLSLPASETNKKIKCNNGGGVRQEFFNKPCKVERAESGRKSVLFLRDYPSYGRSSEDCEV